MTDTDFIKQIKKAFVSPNFNEQGEVLEPSIMNALELMDRFKKSVIKEYLTNKNKFKDESRDNDTAIEG